MPRAIYKFGDSPVEQVRGQGAPLVQQSEQSRHADQFGNTKERLKGLP